MWANAGPPVTQTPQLNRVGGEDSGGVSTHMHGLVREAHDG